MAAASTKHSQPPKYKMTLEYVGTRYTGWQVQPGRKTIQAEVESALSKLAGETVNVRAASRTDAGVHALGQVAHFRFCDRPSVDDLRKALNALLPNDIRVRTLTRASPGFHAQKGARCKRYEYRIYNGPILSPFLHRRVCHIRHPLEADRMEAAAAWLAGRHDFSAFAAASTTVRTRTRTMSVSTVQRRGRHFVYRIEGDGFLHHMVRNIAGTLIEVGLGRRTADSIPRLLASKNRELAGPTAAPEGLYLVKVWY